MLFSKTLLLNIFIFLMFTLISFSSFSKPVFLGKNKNWNAYYEHVNGEKVCWVYSYSEDFKLSFENPALMITHFSNKNNFYEINLDTYNFPIDEKNLFIGLEKYENRNILKKYQLFFVDKRGWLESAKKDRSLISDIINEKFLVSRAPQRLLVSSEDPNVRHKLFYNLDGFNETLELIEKECEIKKDMKIFMKSNKKSEEVERAAVSLYFEQKRKFDRLKEENQILKSKLAKNQKGLSLVQEDNLKSLISKKFNFYALVIGINLYDNYPNLKTPINDTNKIAEILKNKYHFNVTKLINPEKDLIKDEINKLTNQLKENDSLLIYFAGHGVEKKGDGYWVPKDGNPKFSNTWISNDFLSRELKYNNATNILVIADSCYSGTLTKSKTEIILKPTQKALKSFINTRSRMVITSGGLKPVLDSGGGEFSIFASSIINKIKNANNAFTSSELYTSIFKKVTKASQDYGLEQKPMLSSILRSEHIGPDFVFIPN